MKKILYVGNGRYENWAPACVQALTMLGYEVLFFDYHRFFPPGLLGKIQSHFMWGPSLLRLNRTLLKVAEEFNPDLIVIQTGYPIFPETVRNLSCRFWAAGCYPDDIFGPIGRKPYFRIFRLALPFYHSYHTLTEKSVSDFRNHGIRHVRLLLAYFVPWIHYPCRTSYPDGALDVVFVGHAELDERIRYATQLVEAGIPLRLFGGEKEWKRYLPPKILTRLPPIRLALGEAYRHVLSNAKIGLAFFSGGNGATHAFRVFEIPACGGFLLAQRTDLMQTLYEEGKEAEFFSSPEELIDKVSFYLREEGPRVRIAQKGYQRCLTSGYDILSRMKQLISDLESFLAGEGVSLR